MPTSQLEVIAPVNEPVIITHRFIKASPELLFMAWTTPEHMKQWLGPRDGGTMVTTLTLHSSIEARNGHLAGGMERGMTEGYERLEGIGRKLAG
jgi:uncharacterized protein YndB with AHSA1/START domain